MVTQSTLKPIKYVKYGIANSYPKHIEINEQLKGKKYAHLRRYIIKHERRHTSNSFDLHNEFDNDKRLIPLTFFILSHPTTWIDFIPIQFRKKQIVIDFNLICLYIIAFLCFYFIFKIF